MKTKKPTYNGEGLIGKRAEKKVRHTPTPWILGKEVIENHTHRQNIDTGPRDKGGLYVASALLVQDAEFIVRAANAHDKLLDAVKFAYKLAKIDHEEALRTNAPRMEIDGAFQGMGFFRDAIALAEGKGK